MSTRRSLIFKIANHPREIEQIHRLNYETFVEEIPQHEPNAERKLVDRFHDENTYLIALCGDRLVGMLAVRSNRPFSLDFKLDHLDSWLPEHSSICEIRLLAVRPEWRGGQVLPGMLDMLSRYCREHGYDLAIVSGTTRQQKLYRHLGFAPFGPLVGKGDVLFQPMYLTLDTVESRIRPMLARHIGHIRSRSPANFLPGPVSVPPAVKAAFAREPISHRGSEFRVLLDRVTERLARYVQARHLAILTGSGTTANDAIAAQLSLINGYGLIVTNGEFGERLIDHANRFNLKFDTGRHAWGEPLRYDAIDRTAQRDRHQWIWMVHCETSTGMLNDLDRMKQIARESGARLVVDAIGSFGTVPLHFDDVFLASATSGKGLASFAGVGLVFLDHPPRTGDRIPRSLDLGYAAQQGGIPFTMLSNHVAAMDAAMNRIEAPETGKTLRQQSETVRRIIGAAGYEMVTAQEWASPAVFTLALPSGMDAAKMGDDLAEQGVLVSHASGYLRERNWLQICLMGAISDDDIERLRDVLLL